MTIVYESDDRHLSDTKLFVRGVAVLVAVAVTAAAMIARSEGAFTPMVEVRAELVDVGDGLPEGSDVKYHGVLVGIVGDVVPGENGGPNTVRLSLTPSYAAGIPSTVTARVVPSNVFAVPSVQLVDNGPGAPLAEGATIPEDHSRAGVQLQTSLTALNRIVSAVGRPRGDLTVGVLETLERATRGRGEDAVRAGAQLERIVRAYNAEMGDSPDEASLLTELTRAVAALRESAPDMLAALHQSVTPMRSVAEQHQRLTELLTGAIATTERVGTALTNRADTVIDLNSRLGPVLKILAAGSDNFVQMTTSQARLAYKFRDDFWVPATQTGMAKIIVELTPHKQYTRTDCPRYGELEGASCANGPAAGPPVVNALDPPPPTDEQRRAAAEALGLPPGSVGLAELLGLSPPTTSAAEEPR